MPPVTVLMPVYNAGRHLAEAVASILNQSHGTLELLVIDDGSTDDSGAFLDALTDPRVRVVRQANLGLTSALNRGLAAATHEIVARMDADDVAHPDRLRKQCLALQLQPGLSAIGCCFELIDEEGAHIGDVHVPSNADYLKRQLYFRNVLPHGAMMFRASAVRAAGGYREVGPAEDYDLWTRLVVSGAIASLTEPLFRYRITASGMSQTTAGKQRAARHAIRARLHAEHPLEVPAVIDIVRQGYRLRREHPLCADLGASYLFDHTGLAVQCARAGRPAVAARLLVAMLMFALLRPSCIRGLRLFGNPMRRRRQPRVAGG